MLAVFMVLVLGVTTAHANAVVGPLGGGFACKSGGKVAVVPAPGGTWTDCAGGAHACPADCPGIGLQPLYTKSGPGPFGCGAGLICAKVGGGGKLVPAASTLAMLSLGTLLALGGVLMSRRRSPRLEYTSP